MSARHKLEVAVKEERFDQIDEIFRNEPAALQELDESNNTIFFTASNTGKKSVLDYILTHKGFQGLSFSEKSNLWRDAVRGSLLLAEFYYQENKLEEAINALEDTVLYSKKILNKNDDDYAFLHFVLSLQAQIYRIKNDPILACQALKGAVFIAKKIYQKTDSHYYSLASCLNMLGEYYFQNEELKTAEKYFENAYDYCQQINNKHPVKLVMMHILENNLAVFRRESLNIMVHHWGYECVTNDPDKKSSLLETILECLYPDNLHPNRNAVLGIVQHKMVTFFKSSTKECENEAFLDYLISLISETYSLKDLKEALFFSRMFKMNLIIFSPESEPLIIKQCESEKTLYLGRAGNDDYQLLYRRPDLPLTLSLDELFKQTPVDQFYNDLLEEKINCDEGFSEGKSRISVNNNPIQEAFLAEDCEERQIESINSIIPSTLFFNPKKASGLNIDSLEKTSRSSSPLTSRPSSPFLS